MNRKLRFVIISAGVLSWLVGSALAQKSSYSPLTLADAMALAITHNPQLQAARYEVLGHEAGVAKARAGFLPKLEFQEQYTRSDSPIFVFSSQLSQGRVSQRALSIDQLNRPGAVDNFRTNFSLLHPLYTGGRATLGFEQANLMRQASEASLRRQTQEVIFQVTKTYDSILLAHENLAVIRSGVSAAEASAKFAQDRFAAGLVVESDTLSAQVRLASLQEQEIAARNQLTLAYAALNDAVGLPLEEPYTVSDRLEQHPHAYTSVEPLETLALNQRADYQRVMLEEQAVERQVALARSAFFPTLSAVMNYERNQADFVANGRGSWSVGAVLQWNIFNGGEDRARVAEAQAKVRQLHALRARQASVIKLQVKEAFLQLQTAGERIHVAQQAITQAEAALRIVGNRYRTGLTTIVDLLAGETALTQAKGNFARALYDYNVGIAGVEFAVGTLSTGEEVRLPVQWEEQQ